jgi:formate-dependent nitrite reductase membrane component NrfD
MANAASRTPLTLGLLALVVGYYVAFYTGVILAARRHVTPEAH